MSQPFHHKPQQPSTTELACNTDAGQSGAITESAVWSGNALTISPTAGLLGQSSSATSGVLAMGKIRSVNLDQCVDLGNVTDNYGNFVPNTTNLGGAFAARTGVSNTPATSVSCGGGGFGFALGSDVSAVQALDLLGHRYLSLEQCEFANSSDKFPSLLTKISNSAFTGGTNASNTAATTPTCGPGGPNAYIAYELGRYGITANVVSPGGIDTPGTWRALSAAGLGPQIKQRMAASVPLGRIATPADVAGAAAFFASGDAAFMTGTVARVNGGFGIARMPATTHAGESNG